MHWMTQPQADDLVSRTKPHTGHLGGDEFKRIDQRCKRNLRRSVLVPVNNDAFPLVATELLQFETIAD